MNDLNGFIHKGLKNFQLQAEGPYIFSKEWLLIGAGILQDYGTVFLQSTICLITGREHHRLFCADRTNSAGMERKTPY